MSKYLILLLGISIVSVSCLKSGERTCGFPSVDVSAPKSEQDSIKAWLDTNHIEAVKHPTGFYYKIVTPGEGNDTMTLCSEILIDYVGQFKSGQVFDQHTNSYLVLGSLIEGWKKGIPLIRRGGEIKLYIPPSLAYGPNDYVDRESGAVLVPGNSMLIFSVKLKDYTPGY